MSNRLRAPKNKARDFKRKLFAHRRVVPCCFCRRSLGFGDATIEHVIPKSMGGRNASGNLRISCQPCNSQRGVRDFDEFQQWKRGQLKQESGTAE